jgi:replicative DNA helicase
MIANASSEILDRSPPQNIAAEKGVIGSLFLSEGAYDDVASIVGPPDFYDPRNGVLFEAVATMRDAGAPVDIVTAITWLKAHGKLESVGGTDYAAEVLQSVPTAANAAYYAKAVRNCSARRQVLQASTEAIQNVFDDSIDHETLVQRAELRLAGIIEHKPAEEIGGEAAVAQAITRARESMDGRRRRGLPTGFHDFDREIGGLFAGELVIIAARPRGGKSAFACQLMATTTLDAKSVLFVSLEMSAADLAHRMLCGLSGVDSNLVRTGRLSKSDMGEMLAAAQLLEGARFFIDDRPTASVAEIRRTARSVKTKHGLNLLIVDYLQRIEPPDPRAKRHEQIGKMTGALKTLARELSVPVVVLAQLNREIEKTGDNRPRLSHLRESGDVEQDADSVIFLHRPELYNPGDADLRGKAELIVEKNRNGPMGEFALRWDGATTTFKPADHSFSQTEFN